MPVPGLDPGLDPGIVTGIHVVKGRIGFRTSRPLSGPKKLLMW
jgi:hypothetical protein